MERLTEKTESGDGYFYPTCFEKCNGDPEDCAECDFEYEICQRLGEYEDIGLTPEQIMEIDKMYRELAEKLAQHEKADSQ